MSRRVVLAIDVGNSRIKFGLFDGAIGRSALPEPARVVATPHAEPIPWETIGRWLVEAGGKAQGMLAGVNPAGVERILDEWPSGGWPHPRVIRESRELPLAVRVDAPDGVGIDRLLSAVAVNAIRLPGRPAIIIGSGTATTVDVIAGDGAFEGGAILPGLDLGARSLHEHTALLPLVPVDELAEPDLPAIGKNTPAAIRSGLLYGQIGAVKEMIARFSATLTRAGHGPTPLVVINGGNGTLLAQFLGDGVREEPDLPLRGLAAIADESRG